MTGGRPFFFVLAVLIGGHASTLPWARAEAGGAASVERSSVRFRVFALRPIENLAFFPGAEAALQPLEFYPTARSPGYSTNVAGPLRFVDLRTGAQVAEVALAPAMTEVLLVFVPARSEARQPFEILALDDAPGTHPTGHLMILNLSGLDLRGSIGRRTIQVGPGSHRIGPVRGVAGLELRTVHAAREFRAYRDQISVGSDERALLILFPPFYAGSLEVQGRLLLDEKPAEKPVPRRDLRQRSDGDGARGRD